MSLALTIALASQISAAALAARVKENDAKVQDLEAKVRMEIVEEGETKLREFDLLLKRDGVDYDALIVLREPAAMAGTKFLIHAKRGARNEQWAYFPDLDLTREIAARDQDDPFLGSDVTYADLAGGAHLDDLRHTLIGEEVIDGEAAYLVEGVPRHEIVYGKLRGWIRKSDYVNVRAAFYDRNGQLLKEAFLSDVRELPGGARFAHRIEVRNREGERERRTVLAFRDVVVNQGLSDARFAASELARD